MHRSLAALIALTGFIVSCAGPSGMPDRQASVDTTPAANAGVSCVELTRIREARVLDDRTIDFYLRDGTVLRNSLPSQCPGLGSERAFSYSTSLSRLCATDIITVIQSSGPRTGASCGLGRFMLVPPASETHALRFSTGQSRLALLSPSRAAHP